jgi:hypothetical protein
MLLPHLAQDGFAIVPPSGDPWPSGWDDPRFVNNVSSGPLYNNGGPVVWSNKTVIDNSGNPGFGYGNYTLKDCRYRGREGPRVSGSNITIDGCYIEIQAVSGDHGDGIQGYGGGSQGHASNIVIKNTKIVFTGSGGSNAGIFMADHIGCDPLTLDGVYVDGSGTPNGAIWLANVNGDIGCFNLIARNVMCKADTSGTFANRFFRLDPTPSLCHVIEWTNVRRWDGVPIPNPNP